MLTIGNILLILLAFGRIMFASEPGARSSAVLLVANKGGHTLGLIDPDTKRTIATIPESGITGHEVAALPNMKLAFVPIYGDSGVGLPGTDGRTLDVIDLVERRVTHTLDFGHGVRPHCVVIGPKDGMLYVTTELDSSITIVDPHTFKIVGRIPTGQPESHMLAISADGGRGYTANVGPGTVSVLDIPGRKTIAIVPVARRVQRISIAADDRWVFTSDTEKPRLAVIDTKTDKISRWIELPSTGYGTASTPDGKWLLVAMPGSSHVAVVDLGSFEVHKTIPVPPSPQEVLIPPDGQVAYVSCDRSAKVAAIQLKDWGVELIEAGPAADGLAWATIEGH